MKRGWLAFWHSMSHPDLRFVVGFMLGLLFSDMVGALMDRFLW